MDINATLIGQLVSLAIFVWFCMKYVWPPITSALAERQSKIEEGLNAASKAEQSLQEAQAKVADELKAAKQQAAQLIGQANKRAVAMVEEAKHQAAVEAARVKTAAQAEMEQDVSRARDQLRRELGQLAVLGAEKILGGEINPQKHDAMLNELAGQL